MARSPNEELVSRTRESSIRRTVTLGIALAWKSEESKAVMFDLAAEATAKISKTLVELGITIRFSFVTQARIASIESSSLGEIADAILAMADSDASGFDVQELISKSDIVIAEKADFKDKQLASSAKDGPVLLISETSASPQGGDMAIAFTGREDLTALVESVIET